MVSLMIDVICHSPMAHRTIFTESFKKEHETFLDEEESDLIIYISCHRVCEAPVFNNFTPSLKEIFGERNTFLFVVFIILNLF